MSNKGKHTVAHIWQTNCKNWTLMYNEGIEVNNSQWHKN